MIGWVYLINPTILFLVLDSSLHFSIPHHFGIKNFVQNDNAERTKMLLICHSGRCFTENLFFKLKVHFFTWYKIVFTQISFQFHELV